MTRFAAILLALLASVAHGQNIYVRTSQSVSLVAPQESISITAGREFRITVNVVQPDGSPLDLTGVTPRWIIYSAVDGYIGVSTTGTVADAAGGVVRYSAPALGVGEYFVKASLSSSVDPEAGSPAIFWASVTATQTMAAAAVVSATFSNEVQLLPATNNITINNVTYSNTVVVTTGVLSVEGAAGIVDLTSTNGSIQFSATTDTIDFGVVPAAFSGQVDAISFGGVSNFRGKIDFSAGSGITLTPNGTGVTIGATASGETDYEFIMQADATNGTSEITLSAIPQTFSSLILYGTLGVTGTFNGVVETVARMNGDTNGWYGTGRWGQENTATYVAHLRAATFGYLAQSPSQIQPGVGMFRAEFPNYTNSAMNHGWFGNFGAAAGTSTGHYSGTVSAQLSYNANPVTSITIWAVGFGFSTNTHIKLAGVRNQ